MGVVSEWLGAHDGTHDALHSFFSGEELPRERWRLEKQDKEDIKARRSRQPGQRPLSPPRNGSRSGSGAPPPWPQPGPPGSFSQPGWSQGGSGASAPPSLGQCLGQPGSAPNSRPLSFRHGSQPLVRLSSQPTYPRPSSTPRPPTNPPAGSSTPCPPTNPSQPSPPPSPPLSHPPDLSQDRPIPSDPNGTMPYFSGTPPPSARKTEDFKVGDGQRTEYIGLEKQSRTIQPTKRT